ncbi:MAG: phosphoenolpyruvate mutase [Elusimicrobiota bacterium]|jgi:phosphoenolpyruvate phosphomutase|nr:phosphoenolpyruvate mutase [Elusimicrobiota bacterium]
MTEKTKIIYLGMSADIIHPGIINIINEAKKRGDVLVGLLTDAAIATHKRLPYLTYEQRKAVVESIKGIAQIAPQEEWSYVPNLRKYRPDAIIHGDDWNSGILKQERDSVYAFMKEIGGEVIEIPYTQGINSRILRESMRSIGTTPDIRLKSLKRLIEAKKIVRIMEAHSGLSGLIIENVSIEKEDGMHNFDGMWSSSLTDSTNKGKPDIEAVDLTTRMQDLTNILECTTKPIIFDGDTGGKPEHFVFTVRTLERNGISAVIIEDKAGLKKNSLFGTEVKQELASIEDFCEKIKAGKRAQITDDFMIIARLESLIAGFCVSDALSRAKAYVEAGTDAIMIHSKEKSGEDIKEFCIAFRELYTHIPIVLVPTTYNKFTEKELSLWGCKIIIYANHMLRASYPAMVNAAKSILENERSLEADKLCMPIKQILELIPGGK